LSTNSARKIKTAKSREKLGAQNKSIKILIICFFARDFNILRAQGSRAEAG